MRFCEGFRRFLFLGLTATLNLTLLAACSSQVDQAAEENLEEGEFSERRALGNPENQPGSITVTSLMEHGTEAANVGEAIRLKVTILDPDTTGTQVLRVRRNLSLPFRGNMQRFKIQTEAGVPFEKEVSIEAREFGYFQARFVLIDLENTNGQTMKDVWMTGMDDGRFLRDDRENLRELIKLEFIGAEKLAENLVPGEHINSSEWKAPAGGSDLQVKVKVTDPEMDRGDRVCELSSKRVGGTIGTNYFHLNGPEPFRMPFSETATLNYSSSPGKIEGAVYCGTFGESLYEATKHAFEITVGDETLNETGKPSLNVSIVDVNNAGVDLSKDPIVDRHSLRLEYILNVNDPDGDRVYCSVTGTDSGLQHLTIDAPYEEVRVGRTYSVENPVHKKLQARLSVRCNDEDPDNFVTFSKNVIVYREGILPSPVVDLSIALEGEIEYRRPFYYADSNWSGNLIVSVAAPEVGPNMPNPEGEPVICRLFRVWNGQETPNQGSGDIQFTANLPFTESFPVSFEDVSPRSQSLRCRLANDARHAGTWSNSDRVEVKAKISE